MILGRTGDCASMRLSCGTSGLVPATGITIERLRLPTILGIPQKPFVREQYLKDSGWKHIPDAE